MHILIGLEIWLAIGLELGLWLGPRLKANLAHYPEAE